MKYANKPFIIFPLGHISFSADDIFNSKPHGGSSFLAQFAQS
jgi:hypothetical protein